MPPPHDERVGTNDASDTGSWCLYPPLGWCRGEPGPTGKRELKRVYFNERTRDSWRQWSTGNERSPVAVTDAFYRALRKFERLADERRWHVNTPLRPGEIVLFDNARVMHSRTAFEGERHMEGTYISWEVSFYFYSRKRTSRSPAQSFLNGSPPNFGGLTGLLRL